MARETAPRPDRVSLLQRWFIYQRERFPLLGHGPLVAAFSLSAVCCSALLRGQERVPPWPVLLVAFLGSLCFFLQLRIADEFKDADDDARHRPYRPVPRGLVTLRQLGMLGVGSAMLQLGLTLWLHPPLVVWLLLVWLYLGLMSREFFAAAWLRARPFTYLWTHMLIMPLIDVYTSGCEWLPAGAALPGGLKWFLVASFFNGMVIEIGRKIRAPEMEEEGVQTYTALWGRDRAVLAWLAAMALTLLTAAAVAAAIGFLPIFAVLLGLVFLLAVMLGWHFHREQAPRLAKWFEPLSGVWTLVLYLGLGIIPLLMRR